MALERELVTFRQHRAELLPSAGKFVLIHGDDVAGIFDTWEMSIKEGYEQFGLEPFLVKRIEVVETPLRFSAFLPCR